MRRLFQRCIHQRGRRGRRVVRHRPPGRSTWESDSLCGVCQVWKQQCGSSRGVLMPPVSKWFLSVFLFVFFNNAIAVLFAAGSEERIRGETFFSCLYLTYAHLLIFNSLSRENWRKKNKYVCMLQHAYIHIHACTYACVCMYVYISFSKQNTMIEMKCMHYVCINKYIWMYTHVYECGYVCMFMYMHLYRFVMHIYIHTCMF